KALVHFEDIDLRDKQFLRLVVQGQINSGIAMALAGTSRPCSGSEHLISHALDYMELSKDMLHGTQVASISLFTLFLQNKLRDRYIANAKATVMPLEFTGFIDGFSEELFCEIMDNAREMRPGRFTVLARFSNEELLEHFKRFEEWLEN